MHEKMKVNILSEYIKFNNFFGINGAWTAVNTLINELKKHLKVSVNETKGEYDIIHSHGCQIYTYLIMKKFKKEKIPIVITTHQTHHDTENAIIGSKIITPFVKLFLKKYYSIADLLIAPTNNCAKIIKNELKINKKIKVISNGVNNDTFKFNNGTREKFRREYKIKGFTLISVGMPIKRKGFDTFTKIAKKMPEENFIWVGKPAFPIIQKNVKPKYKNMIMPGYIKDLSSAYSGADALLFPSRYEGQGLVVLEAAAAGLPIIVRDIPVYDKWLINGENCLKATSDEDFIKKIIKLKNDESLRRKLSRESIKIARNNDIKETINKILKEYKKLV